MILRKTSPYEIQTAGPRPGMLQRLFGFMQHQPAAPEAPDLSPRGIANATSRVMWLQRGALEITATPADGLSRGHHSPDPRRHAIVIPGGIKVVIVEEQHGATITAPDGEKITVNYSDAGRIIGVWHAVQAEAALDALGAAVPEGATTRPSQVLHALASVVGDMYDRSPPSPSKIPYEYPEEGGRRQKWVEAVAPWMDLGCGVHVHEGPAYYSAAVDEREDKKATVRVLTPRHGVVPVPYRPIWDGIQRRKQRSFADALGLSRALPLHLPMPRGNAQAAYVLRMCRDAVARERDLKDANGAEIEPLVNVHLPRLMTEHAEAAATARPDQLAAIDAALMDGIEIIRKAVEQALAIRHAEQVDRLHTRVGFLEYRHPGEKDLPSAA